MRNMEYVSGEHRNSSPQCSRPRQRSKMSNRIVENSKKKTREGMAATMMNEVVKRSTVSPRIEYIAVHSSSRFWVYPQASLLKAYR
jgi:hypothetical protein